MKLSEFEKDSYQLINATFLPRNVSFDLETVPFDNNLEYKLLDGYAEHIGVKYDDLDGDLIDLLNDFDNWEIEPTTNEYRYENGAQVYFVNRYQVGEVYGGPEEGGWYVNCGQYHSSIVAGSWHDAVELRDRLRKKYDDPYSRSRSSIEFTIELTPGKDYPEVFPHYE